MVVNAIVVTEYDDDDYETITFPNDSVGVADLVAEIFESFGISHNPSKNRAQGRLDEFKLKYAIKAWKPSEAGTIIYWLGHGRGPTPSRLLDSKSVRERSNDGIGADDLVDDLCKVGQDSKFIIIILEACRSMEFVQELKDGLKARPNFNCATLILYSREPVTTPFEVLSELQQILDDVFGADSQIRLVDLQAEFQFRSKEWSVDPESLNLSREFLGRTTQVPTGQTLDIHRRLLEVFRSLSAEERDHFVSKAQSAGSGELTWNFEGREQERQKVLTWLEDGTSPICIVRGEAGQGKSAFLGDIVTRCRSELADALIQAGLMSRIDSWNEIGHQIRAISINASGLGTEQLVERALHDLNKSRPAGLGIVDSLVLIQETVESLDSHVVFIIDGVDEMQDPIEGARTIGALSAHQGIKVLVACRDRPNEGRQYLSFANADLVESILETATVGQPLEIVLEPDREATERYIRRRLKSYLDSREVPERLDLQVKDFLHASVLVREIAFDPEWLDDWELLVGLVDDGLVGLYDQMYRRLSKENPSFIPLFNACALSQGRGLPIAGEVWLTIARAIDSNCNAIDQKTLADFLNSTEQYLRVDVEHGQTVYRPGHSLLRSFLLTKLNNISYYHELLATVCASQVGDDEPNVYYRHAATMHARRAERDVWWAIDRISPGIWNLLDHQRVVEDAMRDLFGRKDMPAGVEDLVLSHHFTNLLGRAEPVEGWSQAVRRGTFKASERARQGKGAWLRWARNLIRQPVFLSLPGDRGRVTAIREASLGPDEMGLLVGTARGDVWLWDLASGGVVTTFKGLTGGIFAVSSAADAEHGLVIMAGDDTGHLAAWSAKSRRQLWTSQVKVLIEEGTRRAERTGPVLAVGPVNPRRVDQGAIVVTSAQLCLVDFLEGSLIASVHADGLTFGSGMTSFLEEDDAVIIIVSAKNKQGFAVFEARAATRGWVLTQRDFITLPGQLKSIRRIHGTTNTFKLLLSGGEVMQWTPDTRPQRMFPTAGGPITMGDVSGSTTRLIDIGVNEESNFLQIRCNDADGTQSQIIASHGGKPTAVYVVDRPEGRALAASGGADRTVRIWDPYSSGPQTARNASLVAKVLALSADGRKTLGVVATQDGNIEFLDGATARPIKSELLHSGSMSLASSTIISGKALIAAGTSDGHVHLWKQNGLDKPQKLQFSGNFEGRGRVVADVDPFGKFVATASSDGLVTVWVQTHQLDQKHEAHIGPSAVTEVKVLSPFEDLVVVLVLTPDSVYCLEFSKEGSRWVTRQRNVPHRLPKSLSYSMYVAQNRIGLLSGASDGQVHSIPQLWTPKVRLSTEERSSPKSLNLRQPVTAIDAHVSGYDTVIVVGGAYGTIIKSHLHGLWNPRWLDLGQHIESVSAWDDESLLAAVQGGVAFLDFGENS